jgi:hypothetical protein
VNLAFQVGKFASQRRVLCRFDIQSADYAGDAAPITISSPVHLRTEPPTLNTPLMTR